MPAADERRPAPDRSPAREREIVARALPRSRSLQEPSGPPFPGCLAGGAVRSIVAFCRVLAPAAALGRGLVELLVPGECRGCGGPAPSGCLCPECLDDVLWIESACPRCGAPVPAAVPTARPGGLSRSRAATPRGCVECRGRRWRFERAIAAARYDGPFRRLVLSHKFRGDLGARRFLIRSLLEVWRRASPELGSAAGWTVTSVPQHPLRRLRRGCDPAGDLARAFASAARWPYRRLVRKRRWTPAQVSLSREERRRNVAGSFVPRRRSGLPPRVILVDDVLTTCATVAACAAALEMGGAREIVVLAAARS